MTFAALLPLQMEADPVIVRDDKTAYQVQSLTEVFVDSTGQLSFESILRNYISGKFSKNSYSHRNLSRLRGTLWFRFEVESKIPEPLYLNFPEIFTEKIKIYRRQSDGHWTRAVTGHTEPYSARDLPFTRYSLLLDSLNNREVIYGSIDLPRNPPVFLITYVGSADAIAQISRSSELLSIAVVGVLLAMLLYNLCLTAVIKERLFLCYCLYILSSIMVVLWFNGFMFEWFWPNSPASNPYPWILGPFYFTQVSFVNRLLQTQKYLPNIHFFSYGFYLLSILMLCNALLPAGFSVILASLLSTLSPVYFLVCAVSLASKGTRIAYIFLIGWAPLMIISVLNIAMINGVLAYHTAMDKHAVELALSWEVIVFSLVLGYRYNAMRMEKYQAQSENIKLINEQKMLLRKMVFEQTEEIMAQNDQLLRNQEEIRIQNEKLETQNKAYERLKELILKQNHELETSVQKRTLQLAQSNEELKRHLHQVEQFSFISAHNLRAPVARILGLASIFDRSKVIGKENIGILDKIVTSAKDLDMIIHDLGAILDTQRNTNEKSEVLDIKDLLYKILNRYEAEVGTGGIHVSINTEAKYVVAIPAYLDSILSNLISNAIKYRSTTKPPYIRITTEEMPSSWRLSVEDNGLGFDSKLFSKKLFEPFQRFHTHTDGKGLGMFLVKTQVTAMQGTISLDSEPDRGTCVVIDIPKRTLQKIA